MIDDAISDLILRRLKPSDRVLDIGGGRFPWFRATDIIDRREYGEMVEPIAYAGNTGIGPCFTPETWTSADFYDLPWPYPDKYFDFSLCMGTLEDLHDPFTIAREICRVSRAGYISTPTRAAESTRGISRHPDTDSLFGYAHHRWFVEINGGRLNFSQKSPLLHQHRHLAIDRFHQHTLHFFWEGEFETAEESPWGISAAVTDHQRFYEEHNTWLLQVADDPTDRTSRYNHWPEAWGVRPRFLELPGIAGVHPADRFANLAPSG